MKKSLFWEIIAVVFIIWLFLFLWNSSIVIDKLELKGLNVTIKINKITGRIDLLTLKGWKPFPSEKKE